MAGLRALLLSLAFSPYGTGVAYAQPSLPPLQNPEIVPNPARAGEAVGARFFFDCPGEILDELITVENYVVTLSHRLDNVCLPGLPGGYATLPLGTFSPGSYQFVHAATTQEGIPYAVQLAQFVVLPASAPIPVPFILWHAVFAMVFGIVLVSQRHLTMR